MADKTSERVFELVKPAVEACSVRLWDVRYLKEGASWYLRIFIDSDEGISIDNCTEVSHAVDPILDEADPIDNSYYLEVCSPGLARELTRPEHFEIMKGRSIKVKLYKAIDGSRELLGTLKSRNADGSVEIDRGVDGFITLQKGEYAKIYLDDDI